MFAFLGRLCGSSNADLTVSLCHEAFASLNIITTSAVIQTRNPGLFFDEMFCCSWLFLGTSEHINDRESDLNSIDMITRRKHRYFIHIYKSVVEVGLCESIRGDLKKWSSPSIVRDDSGIQLVKLWAFFLVHVVFSRTAIIPTPSRVSLL
jgi:hypothetical protein